MASSNPEDAVHVTAESSLTPNPQPVAVPAATTISAIPLPTNSHNLQITQYRLNGRNFRESFQFVKLVIKGKGKFGYVSGDVSSLPKDTVEYCHDSKKSQGHISNTCHVFSLLVAFFVVVFSIFNCKPINRLEYLEERA